MQKTLDKLFPRWVYFILLYIAIFYANYFYNMSSVFDVLGMFELKSAAYMPILTNTFLVAAQFGIFELVSRLLYNFVLRGTYYKGLTCTKAQFVDTLRVFYIFKSIALGTATLIVYFLPYLIPLAVNVFSLLFSVVFYYLFFLYIKNKYVNKEIGGKTFLHLAIPVLIYFVVSFILNAI